MAQTNLHSRLIVPLLAALVAAATPGGLQAEVLRFDSQSQCRALDMRF
jgi:hypothetical protein